MENVDLTKSIIREGRCVGNSTRQADLLIQELFEKRTITVLDHTDFSQKNTNHGSMDLFDKILRRLKFEHRIHEGSMSSKGECVMYNSENLTITLLKK